MPKTKAKSKRSNLQISSEKDAFIKTLIFSVICYVLIYLLACICGLMFDINKSYDFYVSLISFAVSSFAAGFFAGCKLRKNGLITGLLYALPANIIVIIITLLSVSFKPDLNLLITAAVLLASSAVGGIAAVNKRHRR